MTNPIQIAKVEQDGQDGVFVEFSDGTSAGYVIEELLELRPRREHTKTDGAVSLGAENLAYLNGNSSTESASGVRA